MRKNRLQMGLGLVFGLAAVAMSTTGCQTGIDPNPAPEPNTPGTPGGDPNPAPGGDPVEEVKDPSGTWRKQDGGFYSFAETQLEFLELREDGFLKMTTRNQDYNILNCSEGLFATLGDGNLVLSMGGFADQSIQGSGLVQFDMPDDDTLVLLTNADTTTFVREVEVPEDRRCVQPVIEAFFDDLPVSPDYQSGLAFDGTNLWFTADDDRMVYPVDPTTGELGTPVNLTRARDVHAIQDGDFWGRCNCTNALFERRTVADAAVDQVSETELGIDIYPELLAFEPIEKVLWLFGEDNDNDRMMTFYKVNAESEPDVLLETVPFDYYFRAIAADGPYLWGLVDHPQMLVKIDTQTFQAVASHQIQGEYIEWRGVAVAGDSLFVVGEDYETRRGVLMQVEK